MIGYLEKMSHLLYNREDMSNQINRQTLHHHIRVSDEAYQKVRAMSKDDMFRGRGLVGVLDYLILGRFTTIGSGRVDKARSEIREELKSQKSAD